MKSTVHKVYNSFLHRLSWINGFFFILSE